MRIENIVVYYNEREKEYTHATATLNGEPHVTWDIRESHNHLAHLTFSKKTSLVNPHDNTREENEDIVSYLKEYEYMKPKYCKLHDDNDYENESFENSVYIHVLVDEKE